MELGSSSLQDPENEEINENVNLNNSFEEEHINLDEKGEKVQRLEEDSLTPTPEVGMTFDSVDEAYNFYNKYAYVKGFGISKYHARNKDGKLFEVTIRCAKGGKGNVVQDLARKRAKMSKKTDCQAKIRIRCRGNGLWHLEFLILEHNHHCTPGKAQFFRSHKNLSLDVKKQLEFNDEAKVPPSMSYHTFVERGGGLENLTFTERDCRNYLAKVRRLKLKKGDAQSIVDYFLRKHNEDPGFFYMVDLDEDGRLRNVFWADTRSRAMYTYYNDVISFDTTYLTNKYDVPFAPFVGVNHHGSSILLGAGLLCDETTDTYIWLFKAWLACMGGIAPNAIISDQCKAIGNAVANVFPSTRHRLCIWHILKKVPEKFGSHINYHEIKHRLKDVVYHSLRAHEFEEGWVAMVKEYNLHNNEWLKSLFQDRHMWVPTFVKDTFWAGMSSTQRSEQMNAYFGKFVTAATSLQEFVIAYEKALKGKIEKELKDDFEENDKQPTLISQSKLEEQLSKLYTPNMFRRFQNEFQKCLDCTYSVVKKDGEIRVYEVKESVKGRKFNYEVYFNEKEIKVQCICCLFEFKGILCAHAITVLKEECIDLIPPLYICNRWRKDFKRDYHAPYSSSNVIPKSHKERYEYLYKRSFQLFLDMVEVGATSDEKGNLLLDVLMDAKMKFNKASSSSSTQSCRRLYSEELEREKGKQIDKEAPSKFHIGKIRSPIKVRSEGLPPRKRIASTIEKIGKAKAKSLKKVAQNKSFSKERMSYSNVSSLNSITYEAPTQECMSYPNVLSPFGHQQRGLMPMMMPNRELLTQASQVPPCAVNQPHPNWIYGQPSILSQSSFTPPSQNSGGIFEG